MPQNQFILAAENLRKGFVSGHTNLEVLNGANLALLPGEMAILQGVSGTGKSTLLHILGTLDQADSGQVYYNGVNISDMNHKELAKFRNQNIGFVYQFHHLLPEFSALENVMLPGLIAGIKHEEAAQTAIKLLEEVGVAGRAAHRPNQLSGGEAQRVAVARALFNKPTVVYADEPTGNLDNKTGESLMELFEKLNGELNQTFLIATHNERLAERIKRRFVIEDGITKDISVK
jgi:lipoprotein-releasing system ATP-binding protein